MEARKLGRVKRPHGAKFLTLGHYVKNPLPVAPASWDGTKGAVFRMYANDQHGDCTCAAIANLASVQYAGEKKPNVAFTDADVLGYYNAITGGKDEGAVEVDVLGRLAKTGFPLKPTYTISAWAAVNHVLLDEVKSAAALFHGLYIGAELPLSAQGQQVWDVVTTDDGAPGSWGGHAMVLVGYDAHGVSLATWGAVQKATWAWWNAYVDESYVILDQNRKTTDALNWPRLVADTKVLV
jgi:hypothetical protein